ncbi:CRISPR-associated helicase Cas3' [Oceanithermus sp.]
MNRNREEPLAHTAGAAGKPQPLSEHLLAVARLAAELARPQGEAAAALAYWLGIFHDLGKATTAFQHYLKEASEGKPARSVPHSIWGALLLENLLRKNVPSLLSFLFLPVLGHHSHLKEPRVAEQDLKEAEKDGPEQFQEVKEYLKELNPKPPPTQSLSISKKTETEMTLRFLFSTLIDADRLDTEAHFDPATAALRKGYPSLADMWRLLREDQEALIANAPPTKVNRVRREVYEACLSAAEQKPGFFRLTVPTGGGKTRSGLAFALKHALHHDLRRVVVAIPYTSIIDQTADVYRQIFSSLSGDAVLEHHSALEPPEGETLNQQQIRQRLAAENWDHPLIVTTTVQLFESLFANRPSKVRKLHNLARSVIVIDEVQTLPPELLRPTLDALRHLVDHCGTTVVFSTATQPAFELSERVPEFKGVKVKEIVTNFEQHFAALQRVRYQYKEEPLTWEQLAEAIRHKPQVLVVLNTRKDALALLDELQNEPDLFHLSTLLCGAHRREVLAEVRRRLASGEPVRLISTQVVEAGVDLDFPEVWRAIGPLDRIAQAAGRCNREGRRERGKVVIFNPDEGTQPRGSYRGGIGEAQVMLALRGPEALHNPDIFREYFMRLFEVVDIDKKRIQDLRKELNYPGVAEKYRLIENDTVPVVAPYGDAWPRLQAYLQRPSRLNWQRLQPYLVNVYRHDVPKYHSCLEEVGQNIYKWLCEYDVLRGLSERLADPADLVV